MKNILRLVFHLQAQKINQTKELLHEDHMKLVESISRRVNNIYNRLCENDETIDPHVMEDFGNSQKEIMDLLETLDAIQDFAQRIWPYNTSSTSQQQSLEEQVKFLKQTIDLLKLKVFNGNNAKFSEEE